MDFQRLSDFFEAFVLGRFKVLGFTMKELIALRECLDRNDLSVEGLCAKTNLSLGPVRFCQKQYPQKVCTRFDGHDGPCG